MEHIYSASDLSAKRRELIDAARAGFAQIRDTDGTGLVLLPQRNFDLLRFLRDILGKLVTLEAARERPARERRLTDFGELAWLASFEEDDQATFHSELLEAVAKSIASETPEPVETCIRDWRTTATALSNEKSRRILMSPGEALTAFEEVKRPE
jgi:hypothetical protein